MDYANLPPRAEPAALSGMNAAKFAPDAISTRPETARPVVAVESARKTDGAPDSARKTAEAMQPLDTFEVGDNDYVPVPPEPPRQSTVLAIMANAAQASPAEDTAANTAPAASDEAPDSPQPLDQEPTVARAPEAEASSEPTASPAPPPSAPLSAPLSDALRTIEGGPENPTVDIRS